jgi:hypothetical protein
MSTSPSRRSALGVAVAAIVAGITAPALASATASNPDAELIALCDRLVQLRTHELAHLASIGWSDGDDDDPLEETYAEQKALAARARQIDRPHTLEGAAAMARCVVRLSDSHPDGEIYSTDLAEWMAIRVAEFMAGRSVTMTTLISPPVTEPSASTTGPIVVEGIGGWDPCFKPGPCPCPNPCKWVAAHLPKAVGVA